MRSVKKMLSGWGNYLPSSSEVYRPERARELLGLVNENKDSSLLARGLGRSYGDSAVNPGGATVLFERLDRLIEFDTKAGVVTCEAGTSFDALIPIIVKHGWFLPVTPGTKQVTVGGAIAADVHGKNHHVDGCFGEFVDSFDLLTAAGDVLNCSPTENSDVYWATIGGMGLTGVILNARFRLRPVETASIKVDQVRARNLDEAFTLFEQGAEKYVYSVAWIDCLASGESLGRSVLIQGNHAAVGDLPERSRTSPLLLKTKRKKAVPFNFPNFALNPLSVKLFNMLYYAKNTDSQKVVDADTFFYPLDGIHDWNRIYGKRGFVQYQALFPPESSREGMVKLLKAISASRMASFLAVLKATGKAGGGMLSFPFPGHTLALDLPNTGAKLKTLIERLDAIVLDHGGRLYLAKDSLMSRETFARMYSRLDEFKQVKAKLDPGNRFVSAQALRLGIVEGA